MKILASTPKQYNRTSYIVELNSTELLGILCLGSYSKVPVADADGNKGERDKDKLQSGDFIEPEFIDSTAEEIRSLRTHEAEKLAAEKAESERVAAEKANARRAAGAPDRMKLKAFAITVSLLELPSVKSPEAKDIHAEITKEVASFSRWIEEQADKL